MPRILYTSWLSPFARKVAIGLELKGLAYEEIDALQREFSLELRRVNPRGEVPVLLDDELLIVNSSDILQYLDWQYPQPALYPEANAERVAARALERLADHRLDPIVVDCSFWHWAARSDQPPEGLRAAGQRDLDVTLMRLEAALETRPKPWPFGRPGVVECAFFPNLVGLKPLGFELDGSRFPSVARWLEVMREHPVFAHDRKRTAAFLKTLPSAGYERTRLFWSGDRLEWLFARGFYPWFAGEIESARVAFPE
jgi:glutathione S-transferase